MKCIANDCRSPNRVRRLTESEIQKICEQDGDLSESALSNVQICQYCHHVFENEKGYGYLDSLITGPNRWVRAKSVR